MKKIILFSLLLYSLSGYSQTMVLINNTSEVIEIRQLWINQFCQYDFPLVQPQNDVAAVANSWIGPFSATTVYNCGTALGWDYGYDYEWVDLHVHSIPAGGPLVYVGPINGGDGIGTEPTLYYNPASCEPVTAPTASPMPLPAGFTGIRQVLLPDVWSLPAAPSFRAGNIAGGPKIYRVTWQTIYNTSTDKYDVEITVN